jgi:hypothetical protein
MRPCKRCQRPGKETPCFLSEMKTGPSVDFFPVTTNGFDRPVQSQSCQSISLQSIFRTQDRSHVFNQRLASQDNAICSFLSSPPIKLNRPLGVDGDLGLYKLPPLSSRLLQQASDCDFSHRFPFHGTTARLNTSSSEYSGQDHAFVRPQSNRTFLCPLDQLIAHAQKELYTKLSASQVAPASPYGIPTASNNASTTPFTLHTSAAMAPPPQPSPTLSRGPAPLPQAPPLRHGVDFRWGGPSREHPWSDV